MSFFVDPPALLLIGAIVSILSVRFKLAKTLVLVFSGSTIAAFTFGGIGLYLDWFRWVIPGLIDLKGSYIMLDQGLTGLSKATFPMWLIPVFLCFYPFWFTLGYEAAKRYKLSMWFVAPLIIGTALLIVPSIVESHMV